MGQPEPKWLWTGIGGVGLGFVLTFGRVKAAPTPTDLDRGGVPQEGRDIVPNLLHLSCETISPLSPGTSTPGWGQRLSIKGFEFCPHPRRGSPTVEIGGQTRFAAPRGRATRDSDAPSRTEFKFWLRHGLESSWLVSGANSRNVLHHVRIWPIASGIGAEVGRTTTRNAKT
jgi:hypothetical protein